MIENQEAYKHIPIRSEMELWICHIIEMSLPILDRCRMSLHLYYVDVDAHKYIYVDDFCKGLFICWPWVGD